MNSQSSAHPVSESSLETNRIYKPTDISNVVDINDLNDVSQWLCCSIDELSIEYKALPVAKLQKQILEMIGTFEEFPKDRRRAQKILNLLNNGAQPFPVFIEKHDPNLFVMEGRHRMVAFYLFGLTDIPVFLVEKSPTMQATEDLNDEFTDCDRIALQ